MKSLYAGTCNLCYKSWYKGAPIARWTGRWVHRECRDRRARQIATEGQRTVLKDGPVPNTRQPIRPKTGHTRGVRQVV